MNKILFAILISCFLIIPGDVFAHPGRLDPRGGHVCRTNCPKWGYKTGTWHQHKNISETKAVKVQTKVKIKTAAKKIVKARTKK